LLWKLGVLKCRAINNKVACGPEQKGIYSLSFYVCQNLHNSVSGLAILKVGILKNG